MLNLNNLPLPALKRIAKHIGLKGFSTMRKPELMGAIAEAIEDETVAASVAELVAEIEAETPVKNETTSRPSAGIRELTYNGKTQSIAAWADELGLARAALYDRINRHGWSVEEALTIPAGGRRKKAAEPECENCTIG